MGFLTMVRHCFLLNCEANKWRRSNPPPEKLPTFFRFPKSPLLLKKWTSVIPPRIGLKAREPTPKDYLCSLHFKLNDVLKYFEYKFVKGLPKTEVVQMERGVWSLKDDAIPCYFDNDNPDTKELLKEVKHKSTNLDPLGDRRQEGESIRWVSHESTKGPSLSQTDPFASQVSEPDINASGMDSSRKVLLDHCYHTPQENPEKIMVPSLQENSKRNFLKYDPYTIEKLHQDVLDVVLPKNWAFYQSDNDLHTVFMYSNIDGSVNKYINFFASCRPCVTLNSKVVEYRTVNSKKDIEELLELVNILDCDVS